MMRICVSLKFPYCTIRYVGFFFSPKQQVCSWNKVQPPLLAYGRGSSCKLNVSDTWFYKREKINCLFNVLKSWADGQKLPALFFVL